MATDNKPDVSIKTGVVTENGVLIQNLVIRPVQRSQVDITNWRNDHIAAEGVNGTRVSLYDLYADCLLDGRLKRLVAKRVLGVTKNKLKYVDREGKKVDGSDILLNGTTFRKLRKRIQLSKAWGIGVIELGIKNDKFHMYDVPKKHIRPKQTMIVYEQYGTDGINYDQPPYSKTMFQLGEWDDLGYLLEACAYVIYKRGNIADWANFAQIFGMPFREARYDGFNETVRVQLEMALEKAGSAAYAVLPKEAELTFHEPKGTTGSNDLYDRLRQAMNEEMTVHILGATETTTSSDSSGYAQSETHMKTVEEVQQDDKEDELAVLNESVLPILVNLGLLPGGGYFLYDEPINIDIAGKLVDMALKVKAAGVPVSDDHIYSVSGIPKPDNYDELKQQAADAKKAFEPVPQANDTPEEKQKKKLFARFLDFFDQAPEW